MKVNLSRCFGKGMVIDMYKKKTEFTEYKHPTNRGKRVVLNAIPFMIILLIAAVWISGNSENGESGSHERRIVAAASEGEGMVDSLAATPELTLTATPAVTLTTTPALTVSPTPIGTKITVTIDYTTNKVTLHKGAGNSTKFFISTNKKKTWDVIDSTAQSPVIDVTGYMKTSATILYFRGNKDISPVKLEIPKETTNLDIDYKIENGIGKLVTNYNGVLEYRTDKNGGWKDYNTTSKFDTSIYEDSGITLEFRTKAKKDERAGKIVKVKIKKRPTAPSVKVDFNKMVITGLKAGSTLYRVNGTTSTAFTGFNPQNTKEKELSLATLLNTTLNNNVQLPAAVIEFRTGGDDKKLASSIRLIDIKQQPPKPGNITFVGTTLTILDASKDKPYEYSVLKQQETFNYANVKWKSVKNAKAIVIKKTGTAMTIPGDRVYVRQAAYVDSETGQYVPPSLYNEYTVSSVSK